MAITNYSTTRSGSISIVTVTSSLSGTIYYFWYIDGAYLGFSSSPTRAFMLQPGDQSIIDVLDSNDADFDPIANAPAGWPARRTLVFTRSIDANIAQYEIQQQENGGTWDTIGFILDDEKTWQYQFLSPRLADLTDYAWRVVPLDNAGNAGTPVTIAEEFIVRTPDAPNFEFTFDSGTDKVTFANT